jgi:cobalt-zinc-cadmium efflux system outer membrane protein
MRPVLRGLTAAAGAIGIGIAAASASVAAAAESSSPTLAPLTLAPLTLARAVELALEKDPALAAAGHDIRAAEAQIGQAALPPNPEASIEVENAPGTGAHRGFRQAETTLQFGQLFELGGKRAARVAVAVGQRDLARSELEAARIDTMVRVTAAFIGLVGAERRLAVSDQRLAMAERLLPALRRRVEAGASPPADVARGEVAASLARMARDRARTTAAAARRALASLLAIEPAGLRVAGVLAEPAGRPPSLDALATLLDGNPLLTRWDAVRTSRAAELRSEQAQAVPDITVGVGARRFAESNDQALVLSARIPLPVYNRNQGRIEAARQTLAKTEAERQAARREAYGRLSQAYGELEGARGEIDALRGGVLPIARKSYAEVTAGYEQGRFRALELLDAQTTLGEAEGRYVDALVAYHTAIAEIEGLTNRPFITNGAALGSQTP